MPLANVNGIQIYYELTGGGEIPIVLVHGAWSSHHTWDAIVPLLAESFRVVAYDRRGHSQSQRPPGQGSIREDVADLAALIEHLDLAPAWVVGNSHGALIALRLAGQRPELLRGVSGHEPDLFSLLQDDPAAAQALEEHKGDEEAVLDLIASGDHAGGAKLFIEIVTGPGSWEKLPASYQQTLIHNAPTFLDEERDPENLDFDPEWVTSFPGPVLLTRGDESPPIVVPMYARAAELLPNVEFMTIPGAGHVPQRLQSQTYVETLQAFMQL
ncbi:MAG: alpha/beta hydrolase [Chloroflexota bacterium]|jgi:pimeloyl-ACP methyl ester carboxylesterase